MNKKTFTDWVFNNFVKNKRVYEAIKRLYSSGQLDQEKLDNLVQKAHNILNPHSSHDNDDDEE